MVSPEIVYDILYSSETPSVLLIMPIKATLFLILLGFGSIISLCTTELEVILTFASFSFTPLVLSISLISAATKGTSTTNPFATISGDKLLMAASKTLILFPPKTPLTSFICLSVTSIDNINIPFFPCKEIYYLLHLQLI